MISRMRKTERDEVPEGGVVVTVVSCGGEEGFMAANEPENVLADLLDGFHRAISTLLLSPVAAWTVITAAVQTHKRTDKHAGRRGGKLVKRQYRCECDSI